MGDWPLAAAGPASSAGALTATSVGTTITASATVNTKGAWAQLTASSAIAATMVMVEASPVSSSARLLLDIGIGASTAEVVVIPDLLVANGSTAIISVPFLISIPAGTRISARCQSATASTTMRVKVTLFGQSFGPSQPLSRVTAYGAVTATTAGTSVNPGATINTKGAWTQVDAACANPIRALTVMLGDAGSTTLTAAGYLVDIGIGPATEQVIIADLQYRASGSFVFPPSLGPLPVNIPSGTRLAIRSQSTVASQALEFALYGMD